LDFDEEHEAMEEGGGCSSRGTVGAVGIDLLTLKADLEDLEEIEGVGFGG